MTRKLYVAGNWKMNLTLAEGRALVQGIASRLPADPPVDVAVFPPFVLLQPLSGVLKPGRIGLGGQNCYFESHGAFTGEISPQMLKDVGCSSVIIGHSERRHVIGETGEMLKKKVVAALAAGLEVIYCIGETLAQREADKTESVLARQLEEALGPDVGLEHVTLAYEPVWAIGTGRTATPAQAQAAHAFVRQEVKRLYNAAIGERARIQYGGSVKADNARELMSQVDVDGVLVGGASLKVDEFAGIIEAAIAVQTGS